MNINNSSHINIKNNTFCMQRVLQTPKSFLYTIHLYNT